LTWAEWVDGESARIHAAGRWRQVRTWDLDRLVSFASNDYLGLSTHRALAAAACDAAERWGTGATASRLVVGSRPVHDELEAELAAWKGAEAALLFPTGYAANVGVLTTFGVEGARILSDELNHASIVDGARLARADVAVYRHLDLDHLALMLAPRSVVVTDTVFSMDGDVAPVDDLVALWKTRSKASRKPSLPARTTGQARAQLKSDRERERGDGKADLKWSGGRAGS